MFPQRKGGLTFLFKKQFNPANIANQAEVYDAEQRYEREMKMLEQRKKDLAEQEEISRLRREQALATGKAVQERVEWMYEDPLASSRMPLTSSAVETAAHQEQLESYLLGKEYLDPRGSEIKQVQNAIGAAFVETGYDPERDALRKVQEDPMLLIRKSEQASLRAVLENPMKMRALSEQKMTEYLKKWKKAAKKCGIHRHHHRHSHEKEETNNPEKEAAKKKLAKIEDGIAHLLEADKTGKAREVLQETEPTLAEQMKKRVPLPQPPAPTPGKIIADARRQQKLLALGKLKREREDEKGDGKEEERDRDSRYGLHVPEGPLPKRMKELDDDDHDRHHHSHHHSHRRHRSHRSRSRSRSHSRSRSGSSDREKRYDARKHRREVQEDIKRKRRMTQEERDRYIEQMKRNGEVRLEQKHSISKKEDDMEKKDLENAAHTLSRDEKPEFIEKMHSSVYGSNATLEDRVQRNASKYLPNK